MKVQVINSIKGDEINTKTIIREMPDKMFSYSLESLCLDYPDCFSEWELKEKYAEKIRRKAPDVLTILDLNGKTIYEF